MNPKIEKHLKRLALEAANFQVFIGEIIKWPRRYAVTAPKIWNKLDYETFFNQIKGVAKCS